MPQWGRLPGVKGRQKQGECRVVMELDSDNENAHEVGLALGKRVASDLLHFTDTDPSTFRSRKNYFYQFEESKGLDEDFEELENSSQVALRGKEEALLYSALARIRRAQEKGKKDVKLDIEEIAALEKRRKRMQAAGTAKAQKGNLSNSGSGSEKRRGITVPLSSPIIKGQNEPKNRKKGKTSSKKHPTEAGPSSLLAAGPSAMTIPGPNGMMYAPVGCYTTRIRENRYAYNPTRSATTFRHFAPPVHNFEAIEVGHGAPRNFSDSARPSSRNTSVRLLPDDENWQQRSSSYNKPTAHLDPFEYQIHSNTPFTPDKQHVLDPGRRDFSGPAEATYSMRHSPPMSAKRATASSDDLRRSMQTGERDELGEDSEDGDSSDELDRSRE